MSKQAGEDVISVSLSDLQDDGLTGSIGSPTVLAFLQHGRDLLQDYEITLSLRKRT